MTSTKKPAAPKTSTTARKMAAAAKANSAAAKTNPPAPEAPAGGATTPATPNQPGSPAWRAIVQRAEKTEDKAGAPLVRLPDGKVSATTEELADKIRESTAKLMPEQQTKAQADAIVKKAVAEIAAKMVSTPDPAAAAKLSAKMMAAAGKPQTLGKPEAVQLPTFMLAAALFATADKGDVREYLKGVRISGRDEATIRVEASNGHVLFQQDYPVERVPSWAKGEGIILERERLAAAIKLAGKDDGAALSLSFGENHPHVLATTAPDAWVQVKVAVLVGKFPDTSKVASAAMDAYANAEAVPLMSKAISPEYVAVVGKIAGALNVASVTPFIAPGNGASIFTFGLTRAILYVMPIKTDDGGAMPLPAARMLGGAMTSSIAALKAHATRARTAAAKAPKEEREALLEKVKEYDARIAKLLEAARVALPAPAAA
jgi:hypothetical protein